MLFFLWEKNDAAITKISITGNRGQAPAADFLNTHTLIQFWGWAIAFRDMRVLPITCWSFKPAIFSATACSLQKNPRSAGATLSRPEDHALGLPILEQADSEDAE